MKKISKTQILRYAVLTIVLIIVTVAAFRHQILGGGPGGAPSVHAICPFGGLETLFNYVAGGEYLKKTNISNFILLAATIIIALLLGRLFCGWICMLGWLQELPARLGQKIFRKRFTIPLAVDRPLRYLKYILLFVILYFTWKMADLVFGPYDPFAAYAHIPAGITAVIDEYPVGAAVLAGSLILSFFYDRFFCKYLCPMGAFLGIVYKISNYKIKRDKETCINCNKCSKICPVNIDVAQLESVTKSECINCLECVTVCPTKKETLKPFALGKYFKPLIVGIAGVVIYFGIFITTDLAGIWKSTEDNLAEVVTKQGALDPYSIRGFMAMDEIAKTFNIDINVLYKELGISIEKIPPATKMKEMKNFDKKIEEDTVRDAVAKILGISKSQSSTEIQSEKAIPAPESEKSVQAGTLDPASISGLMTIKEICGTYNIKKEDLYAKINVPASTPDTITGKALRDLMVKTDPSFEVEKIRNAVRELTGKKELSSEMNVIK